MSRSDLGDIVLSGETKPPLLNYDSDTFVILVSCLASITHSNDLRY